TDKFTGRSRGFGFVEMSSSEEAQKAIQALNGTDLDGRSLTVNEARPQEKRSGFGGDRGGEKKGGGGGRKTRGIKNIASHKKEGAGRRAPSFFVPSVFLYLIFQCFYRWP